MTRRLLAVAAAAVAGLYGRAWRFDLQCDDFVYIRPWSSAEVQGVWHGTWDPNHVDATFFRPLASWFLAGTFEAFGVHAVPHLLLSLALLTAVVAALAVFVARESGSTGLGALAAVIYALHPNTPWSTGVWVMNDFHKLAALAVLTALLVWQRVRARPLATWWPILLLATAAFLVKEDNLMLMPALLSAQWLRARMLGDVAPPARGLWVAGALACAGLWTWRWWSLGQLGGFVWPHSIAMAARNVIRGPYYALTGQADESAGFSLLALIAGGLALTAMAFAITRLPRARQWLAVFGITMMAWYAAPLALISSPTRYYVITLAATLVLVSAVSGLWTLARTVPRRVVVAVGVAALMMAAGVRQQAALDRFAPCGPLPLACPSWMLEKIATLPPESRAHVTNMAAACDVGDRRRFDDLGVLTWGLVGAETVDTTTSTRTRRAGAHIVTLLRADATTATVTFRHPDASASAPVDVSISANGPEAMRLRLTSAEWTTTAVPVTSGWRTWLRGMHRVDIRVAAGGAERTGLDWQSLVPKG